MIILQAILLGIIEGLTEFLPISSTGHLLVSEKLLGYKDTAEIFTVVIQVGAIAAVVWHYRKDLLEILSGLMKGEKNRQRFLLNWVIATIPAGLAGLVFDKKLGSFATLPVIAGALIVGGLLMWAIETYHQPKSSGSSPRFESLTPLQSVKVGCYQVLSLVPGVSRSGATIMGGLMSGLDRVTATAFSFYLSLPILVLASGYKIVKGRNELHTVDGGASALIIGTVTTFVVAFFVIGWLLRYVSRNNFKPFAYYRIALGALILTVLWLR